jgi:hypothetical protein
MSAPATDVRKPFPTREELIHELEDTALGLDRGVGGLIEEATHLTVAFGERSCGSRRRSPPRRGRRPPWCQTFSLAYARRLQRGAGPVGDTWHLDELFVTIRGRRQYLWRAIDQATSSTPCCSPAGIATPRR